MFVIPVRLSLQKKLQIPRIAPFVPQGKRDESVKTRAKIQIKNQRAGETPALRKPDTKTRCKNLDYGHALNQGYA
jgi:hypothetical protein